MIWNLDSCGAEPAPGSAGVLAAELADACARGGLPRPEHLEDLAHAMAGSLAREPRAVYDPGYACVLASRALAGLGEDSAAQRLALLGTGVVRRVRFDVAGGRAVWVLDLGRLSGSGGMLVEMAFFALLKVVLESLAGVWDDHRDPPVLGLRNLAAAARGLLGRGRHRPGAVRTLEDEIAARCGDALEAAGRRRGWREPAAIVRLDVAPRGGARDGKARA